MSKNHLFSKIFFLFFIVISTTDVHAMFSVFKSKEKKRAETVQPEESSYSCASSYSNNSSEVSCNSAPSHSDNFSEGACDSSEASCSSTSLHSDNSSEASSSISSSSNDSNRSRALYLAVINRNKNNNLFTKVINTNKIDKLSRSCTNDIGKYYDDEGLTAAHLAIKTDISDDAEILKIFIDNGIDPNLVSLKGQSLLDLAIILGRKNCIDLLLKNEKLSPNSLTPLILAAHHGNEKAFESLLSLYCEKYPSLLKKDAIFSRVHKKDCIFSSRINKDETLFHCAIEGKNEQILTILLKLNEGIKRAEDVRRDCKNNVNSLLKGIVEGVNEKFNKLKNETTKKLETIDNSWEMFFINIFTKNAKTFIGDVKSGINNVAEKMENFTPPLLEDVSNKSININELKFEDNGNTILHHAIDCESSNLINLLLIAGADINAKNNAEQTPLTYAIEKDNIDAVQALLENTASIENLYVNEKTTILHWLAAKKDTQSVAKLFADNPQKSNVLLESKNNQGETTLHIAVREGNDSTIKALLYNKANPNAQNSAGETPLHIAAQQNKWSIYDLLKEKGADENLLDRSGKSPLFLKNKFLASQGDVSAQFEVGHCLELGQGVAKDEREAVEWYKKAAELENPRAQDSLGYCYFSGRGVRKNLTESFKWTKRAAEHGLPESRFDLGVLYFDGLGVAKDEAEAVKWYQEAAKLENPRAQFILGNCYFDGRGVVKDESEAVKWYQKAAAKNFPEAQFILGKCYFNGRGIVRDEAEAIKWYQEAAKRGNPEAQLKLGDCYFNGKDVVKDEAEAVKWYQEAAKRGNPEAQLKLGHCYFYGRGVEKNATKAIKWYQKAAEQGDQGAITILDKIGMVFDNLCVGIGLDKLCERKVLDELYSALRKIK